MWMKQGMMILKLIPCFWMSQYQNDWIEDCHQYDNGINRCIVDKLFQKINLLLFHIDTWMHITWIDMYTILRIEKNTKMDLLFDDYLQRLARCISAVYKLEINGSIIINTCNDTICCFENKLLLKLVIIQCYFLSCLQYYQLRWRWTK